MTRVEVSGKLPRVSDQWSIQILFVGQRLYPLCRYADAVIPLRYLLVRYRAIVLDEVYYTS